MKLSSIRGLSPLRYPGGKTRFLKQIMEVAPTAYKEFREPFVGGGSVFSYIAQEEVPPLQIKINDIYEELYLFWNAMKENNTELIEQVIKYKNSIVGGKNLFKFLKDGLPSFNNLEKASAFFILNRITFSGTTLSGGFSQAAYEGRFLKSFDKYMEKIKKFEFLLKNVIITNNDYSELLFAPSKYDNKDVFIFLDPPYYTAKKSALYGKNGNFHKYFDHEKFATDMKKCPYNWLITYDNCDYIKDLFSFANIKEWSPVYGMRNVTKDSKQQGKEIFVSNY